MTIFCLTREQAVLNVVRTLPASYSGRIHVYNSDDRVVLLPNKHYRPNLLNKFCSYLNFTN